MIKFNENAFDAANVALSSRVNVVDGLVELLNSWEYGLAQEAVCLAEFEVLAEAEDRDLDKINNTLKWYNMPLKYRSGNAVKVGRLTKVNNDSVELLDDDDKTVIIDSARRLVPFELYNAVYHLNNLANNNI